MSEVATYFLYYASVSVAAALAGLYQKRIRTPGQAKEKWINIGVLLASVLILVLLMGLREVQVGVDDSRYRYTFRSANSMSVQEYYQTFTTEPGFYLAYRIIGFLTEDFGWFILATSAVTLLLFMKAMLDYIDILPFGLTVFAFGMVMYFYYFGIIRLGLATSIIAASYIFIQKRRIIPFIIAVLVATSFHFSALFALILVFLVPNKNGEPDEKRMWLSGLLIPIAFLLIRFVLYPMLADTKYGHYLVPESLVNIKFLTELPFFILFTVFYKKLKAKSKANAFFYFACYFRLLVEMFSPTGIGRVIWYLSLCQIILLCQVPGLLEQKWLRRLGYAAIVAYCVVYSLYAYFGFSFRAQYMIPYQSILF